MAGDLDLLQGDWTVVSLEMDGQKISGGGAQIAVCGERFTTIAMGATYEGSLAIHQSTAPKRFELHFEEGPEKGNTSLGIYELDGHTWKICLTTRGTERPTEFAATPGTGFVVETLERATARAREQAHAVSEADTAGFLVGHPAPELAGEWTAQSLVRDGQAMPESMLKHGKRVATAGEVTVKFGPTVMLQASYGVDRSRVPMTMDYLLADGKPQYGIWVLEGKRLTVCFGAPGQPRPGEFRSSAGDGRTLTVWISAGE